MPSFIQEKLQSRYNFGFLLGPAVGTLLLLIGEGAAEFFSYFFSKTILKSANFSLFLDLFSFIFITLAVIIWARKIEQSPWQGFGFAAKNAVKDFIWGWFWGACLLSVCVLAMTVLGSVTFEFNRLSASLFWQFLVILPAWAIQGHAEETLVRGWLFSSIAVKNKIVPAVIVSALFFTAIHLGNDGLALLPVLDLLLFGILAALYLLKTGSIWGISGLHAAWNCFQGSVFSFPVSGTSAGPALIKVTQQGPDWLSGGSFGVEGSIISILAQTAVILFLLYDLLVKKSISRPQNK